MAMTRGGLEERWSCWRDGVLLFLGRPTAATSTATSVIDGSSFSFQE